MQVCLINFSADQTIKKMYLSNPLSYLTSAITLGSDLYTDFIKPTAMIQGPYAHTLPFKKRVFKPLIHKKRANKGLARTTDIIQWCGERHERSADINLLPPNKQFAVRQHEYAVNGSVVATMAGTKLFVFIWGNGLVEWLSEKELSKYRESYRNWWIKTTLSRAWRESAHAAVQKLNKRVLMWTAEHRLIGTGQSQEEDFIDGFEFSWK
jgi:hypothetical protein